MEIVFESASAFCSVKTTEFNPKTQKDRGVSQEVVLDKQTLKDFDKLKTTDVSIIEKDSKKFQTVRLLDLQQIKEKGTEFTHLSFLYIYREKGTLKVTKLKQKPRTIDVDGDEYPCVELFATIVAGSDTIILDRRANLAPLSVFMHTALSQTLTPANYNLTNKTQLEANLRVDLHQNLKKNFKELLKDNYGKMKKLSFTVAKPISVVKQKKMTAGAKKQGLSLGKGLLKTLFGQSIEDSTFLDLPIKKFQIEITLDDDVKKGVAGLKKDAKDNLLEYIENDLITTSAMEYEDDADDSEIKRAVLAGLRVTEQYDIKIEDAEDAATMWKKQRQLYFDQQ